MSAFEILNRPKKILMTESQLTLLLEGAETKNMRLAKHYLYNNMGYNEQQAMQLIGQIKTSIPNVRLAKCKFILAATRMFCNNELSDGQSIMNLNKTLKLVASDAHVNEYDNNLNNMSCQEIIDRFATNIADDLEASKQQIASKERQLNQDYQIVRIETPEKAQEYGDYTDWCVTYDEDMYNEYTNNGEGIFYFCLKNGFEDVNAIKGENCPLDKYGLSMIAVSVNDDGSCNTITCRWNHANGGNDNVMTEEELSDLLGGNFYVLFPPRYTKEELEQKRKQERYEMLEAYSTYLEARYYREGYYDEETGEETIEYDDIDNKAFLVDGNYRTGGTYASLDNLTFHDNLSILTTWEGNPSDYAYDTDNKRKTCVIDSKKHDILGGRIFESVDYLNKLNCFMCSDSKGYYIMNLSGELSKKYTFASTETDGFKIIFAQGNTDDFYGYNGTLIASYPSSSIIRYDGFLLKTKEFDENEYRQIVRMGTLRNLGREPMNKSYENIDKYLAQHTIDITDELLQKSQDLKRGIG